MKIIIEGKKRATEREATPVELLELARAGDVQARHELLRSLTLRSTNWLGRMNARMERGPR